MQGGNSVQNSVKGKNGYTKDELTVIKRESKSFEAVQQCLFIAILNTHGFGFLIKRPERMAVKTLQLLTINEMYCNDCALDFGSTIERYCEEKYSVEIRNITETNAIKTIKRRRDLNRSALSFSWLLQYAHELGCVIKKRPTKKARKTLKLEKVHEVIFDEKTITKADMYRIGTFVNKYITSLFTKSDKEVLFHANDKTIGDYLKDELKKCPINVKKQQANVQEKVTVEEHTTADAKVESTSEEVTKGVSVESAASIKKVNYTTITAPVSNTVYRYVLPQQFIQPEQQYVQYVQFPVYYEEVQDNGFYTCMEYDYQ